MEFESYQHIVKWGHPDMEGIQFGECFVFPKLDGTNASAWLSGGVLCGGSRRRELSRGSDNAGFYEWLISQDNFFSLFDHYPHLRLYGEWLVPHTLKTYRENAWRRFWVFDVTVEEIDAYGNLGERYLPYNEYKSILDEYQIDYLSPLAIVRNGTEESFVHYLDQNNFLIQDGKGVGEGIVIKRYDYVNKYGRVVWAKMVRSEFKEQHHRVMGAPEVGCKEVEDDIADEYVTKALVDKVVAKIMNGGDSERWESRFIPRLLETVWHDLITEEAYSFVKKFKNPTVNFKRLRHLTTNKIKEHSPDLF